MAAPLRPAASALGRLLLRARAGAPAGGRSQRRRGFAAWSDGQYQHFRGRGPGLRTARGPAVALVGGGVAAASGLYYVTHLEMVPFSKRRHFIVTSVRQERQMGDHTYRQVLQQHRGRVLPAGHPAARAVARVGQRLAREAGDLAAWGGQVEHMRGLRWTFTVIDSPELNAFVLPGGHVCVFTGLLKLFRTDDELATIVAHEVAHVVARHGAEKVSTGQAVAFAKLLLYSLFDFSFGPVFSLALELPNSRTMELEADALGLQLMAKACFNPRVAPGVFERLGEANRGARPPEYLSTHPSDQGRSAALRRQLPEALWVYEAAGCEGLAAFFRR